MRLARFVPGILCGALWMACAATCAAQEIRFKVAEQTLDNGLKVLVVEDHSVPAVTYFTLFRVGSRNERTGRTGISHLFEHMMFNGSRKYGPGEFDRQLESRGGLSNAFTSEDVTGYYETFPSDAFELMVDIEADRMAALQIDEKALNTERDVVKEERRLRLDNDVHGAMDELLNATAYMAHPYGWPVVGWTADLDAIGVDDCREFFRVHYAPNNAVIILAGDISPERAFELIRRAFGGMPAETPPPPVVTIEPPQRGERRAVLRKTTQLPELAVAYHVPGTRSEGDVLALDLIETILGAGESSRLNRALVHDQPIASSVSVTNSYRIDPSLFTITTEALPGVGLEALEQALYAELERLGTAGVSDEELQKARNLRAMALARELKTSRGKAQSLGAYELYFGSYAKLFEVGRKYQAISKEAIAAVAARTFQTQNRTVVTVTPGDEPPVTDTAGQESEP